VTATKVSASWDSAVRIATWPRAGQCGDQVPAGCPDRLWHAPSLLFSGYRTCFPEIKRPGREVEHPPPCSVEVKNEWSYTSASHVCLHSVNTDITFSYQSLGVTYCFHHKNSLLPCKGTQFLRNVGSHLPDRLKSAIKQIKNSTFVAVKATNTV
jgi:hypothetical protein